MTTTPTQSQLTAKIPTERLHAESAIMTASASLPENHTADARTRLTEDMESPVDHANIASQLTKSHTAMASYTEKLTT